MRFLCLALCFTAATSFAQTVPDLILPAPLAEYVDATPKLMLDTPEALKINATLARFDTGHLAELTDCEYPSRDVRILHRSSEFYSLRVSEGTTCEGAAHPYYAEWMMTFDLTTGEEVNWESLLPESLLQKTDINYDENYPLRSEALAALYLAHIEPNPDCDDVFSYPRSMSFALDAENKSLALAPTDLAYVEIACGDTALISLEEAKTLGLDPRLIAALETGAR